MLNTKSRSQDASLGHLTAQGCHALQKVSGSPRLDAEVLLAHIAGIARSTVLAFPERTVGRETEDRFLGLIKEFYSLELAVTSDTLVPRPETELLVEKALAWIPEEAEMSVLDLGTGGGAIALAIKKYRPRVCVTATDLSAAALSVAESSGTALGLDVCWLKSNGYDALLGERFDLIVTNPPYVASGDPCLLRNVCFEPRLALDGGVDGLDVIRIIVAGAKGHLYSNGRLLLEHAFDQRIAVIRLLQANSLEVLGQYRDLAHHPRVLGAQVST